MDPAQIGGTSYIWRWSPVTNSVTEVAGGGVPDGAGNIDLLSADRGDIVWRNDLDGSAGGTYITNVSTGIARRVLDNSVSEFGVFIGLDGRNLYGASSFCSGSACPITSYGFARDGGTPPVTTPPTSELDGESGRCSEFLLSYSCSGSRM